MKAFFKTIIICSFILSTTCFVAHTQVRKLRFEHHFIEKGTIMSGINCLLQDCRDYIWFGSVNGLNKYDGYNITTYKHDPYDSASLIGNSVFSLWEDKEGMIWIGTAEGGMNRFDRSSGKFTRYQPGSDTTVFVPAFRAVSAFNEDKEGFLWVANYLGELRRFDKQSGKFFPEIYDLDYHAVADTLKGYNNINCIYKDHTGTLWIGDVGGLHKMNITPGINNHPSTVSFNHYRHDPNNTNSLSFNSVACIFEDHAGMLWIGTGGFVPGGKGLDCFNPKTGIFTHYQHDASNPNSISCDTLWHQSIAEDAQGNLWVGTWNGLNKLNRDRTQFTRYFNDHDDPESLAGNLISSLLIDRAGNLWVDIYEAGLDRLDLHQNPFNLYHHYPASINSLSNDSVFAITGNADSIVWIGTWGGGLDAFNKKSGQFTHYRHNPKDTQSLGNDFVVAVSKDNNADGNMWVLCKDLLSIFNLKTRKFVHYYPDNPRFKLLYSFRITIVYEDRKGLLWLGTDNGLKSFDNRTGRIINYGYDPKNFQGLSDPVVIAILEDNSGYLWLGHNSVGLSRLDKKTGVFKHYLPNVHDSTSLSASIVNSIFEDSKGGLWFGTMGGGLCRFNPAGETFTTYTEKQGLADNNVWSIQEDADGNLWLGIPKGISRFSPATDKFVNYDYRDGLDSRLNSAVSFSGRDGMVYYGGTNGLTSFNPRALKPNTYIPPVVITQFKLFDKLQLGKNEASEINLNYDENFFSFEFAALNYTNNSKNQYAYKLEGVDKDWVYSGTRRFASYTDVDPGRHTFRVKGANNDGLWNNNGTSMVIIIHPPWWRTGWAYAFYTLCFLAGVFAVHTYQRNRLIQKERERTKERELAQAREIEKAYHELKATQAQLIQSEKMASLGQLTAGIAHEIQNPLNFVNNFSEINTELMEELEEEVDNGNYEEVKAIVKDLKDNEQKIIHHGKRADSIVKGMLQHSRASSGKRELTDINALVDECVRLSYHGMRARDKEFNAEIKTDFDGSIGKVNVVPQDISRVLLNLLNNAFYAVDEKKRQLNGMYEPTVFVCTKKLDGKVEIVVKDNGNGIPQNIVDKIFQPFFTTKPTGQGTGLGLSLSYDIIKAHGGEIGVESKEGEGTVFIMVLPLS